MEMVSRGEDATAEKVNGTDRDVSEKTWEEARRWWEFEASMELESRNIEEKIWSWFRGKGTDTDKKFDVGGRVKIDAVDGGEELVQR
ncbi:unnamed protein product [Brassica oleracea]